MSRRDADRSIRALPDVGAPPDARPLVGEVRFAEAVRRDLPRGDDRPMGSETKELIARIAVIWAAFGAAIAVLIGAFSTIPDLPQRVFTAGFGGMVLGFLMVVPALVAEHVLVGFLARRDG